MPRAKKDPSTAAGAKPPVNGIPAGVLTLSEAAAYLRLSEADVVALVHGQGLPGRFTGHEWRFLKSAIQQWLGTGAPTRQARKEAQLALAGKYQGDPDLIRICEDAYRTRACPPTEDE
jgi:excisionase family DNA binding protein